MLTAGMGAKLRKEAAMWLTPFSQALDYFSHLKPVYNIF
jgi:hypothetical protein